ncbi:MAG: hypothetical protein IT449_06390 [Phycisphaerales bacterium]|nr:hypothetical protein [Phycisphaerales bacterium]
MLQESTAIQTPSLPEVPPVETLKGAGQDFWAELDSDKLWYLLGLVCVLVAFWLTRKGLRFIRRRRPAKLHPKLQRYGDASADASSPLDLAARRHAEAARIVATSSTAEITGYDIIEQIEAVYVDGFRKPEEALEGLKAVAAMKGANAVIRVRQERSAGGRCTASGDGVVVRKVSGPAIPDPSPAPRAAEEALHSTPTRPPRPASTAPPGKNSAAD